MRQRAWLVAGFLLAGAGVVEAKTMCVKLDLECPLPNPSKDKVRPSTQCARYILKTLEAAYGLTLEAREGGSAFQHGGIAIDHCNPNDPAITPEEVLCRPLLAEGFNHLVCVTFIEQPSVNKEGVIQRPAPVIPSEENVITRLRAVPKPWTRMNGFDHRLEPEIKREADEAAALTTLRNLGLTDDQLKAFRGR